MINKFVLKSNELNSPWHPMKVSKIMNIMCMCGVKMHSNIRPIVNEIKQFNPETLI